MQFLNCMENLIDEFIKKSEFHYIFLILINLDRVMISFEEILRMKAIKILLKVMNCVGESKVNS